MFLPGGSDSSRVTGPVWPSWALYTRLCCSSWPLVSCSYMADDIWIHTTPKQTLLSCDAEMDFALSFLNGMHDGLQYIVLNSIV